MLRLFGLPQSPAHAGPSFSVLRASLTSVYRWPSYYSTLVAAAGHVCRLQVAGLGLFLGGFLMPFVKCLGVSGPLPLRALPGLGCAFSAAARRSTARISTMQHGTAVPLSFAVTGCLRVSAPCEAVLVPCQGMDARTAQAGQAIVLRASPASPGRPCFSSTW